MKKKLIIFQFLYYIFTVIVYMAFFYTVSLMLDIADAGLGEAVFATYVALLFMTPVLVAFLMRFSLFKWYVDPIAAAVIPLFLYGSMIINTVRRSDRGLESAFLVVNRELADDGGAGFIFLILLFAFGLIASFSVKRAQGKSISYRLLFKEK